MTNTKSEYIDGSIIFTDNSSVLVKTTFYFKSGFLDEICTTVDHSNTTRTLCTSKYLAEITIKLLPSIKSIKIEDFYVNASTVNCRMSPEDRNVYKRLGELIFSIVFNHIGDMIKKEVLEHYDYVIADVVDVSYKYDKKGTCALLDKIYYNKYKFQEVNIKLDDTPVYVTLDDKQIKKCYDSKYKSIHVRSTLLNILSQLDNYNTSYDLFRLSKLK